MQKEKVMLSYSIDNFKWLVGYHFNKKGKSTMTNSACMDAFVAEIEKYDVVGNEEAVSLMEMAKQGNENARQRLINGTLRLVLKIAHDYKFMDFEEAVSNGRMGLVVAVNNNAFDSKKGTFSNFASIYINKYIRMGLEQRDVKTKRYDRMNEEERQSSKKAESLNEKMGNGETEFANSLIDGHSLTPAEAAEQQDTINAIYYAIGTILSADEKFVMQKRYERDEEKPKMTLMQIAQLMGKTHERVRQLEASAMQKIREWLEEN